jgi:hypothetical protein
MLYIYSDILVNNPLRKLTSMLKKEEVPMPRFYINQGGSKYSEFLSSPLAPNLLFQTFILTLLNFFAFLQVLLLIDL